MLRSAHYKVLRLQAPSQKLVCGFFVGFLSHKLIAALKRFPVKYLGRVLFHQRTQSCNAFLYNFNNVIHPAFSRALRVIRSNSMKCISRNQR